MKLLVNSGELDRTLLAIAALTEERGPSIRELQDEIRLSSPSVAAYRLHALERLGLVEQPVPYSARGWRLTAAGHALVAELLAKAAG